MATRDDEARPPRVKDRPRPRPPRRGTRTLRAEAEAAMADAIEAKAAADGAAARVRRERDRLERDKSVRSGKRAARERQTVGEATTDASAAMAREREEIKADAERLRQDGQRWSAISGSVRASDEEGAHGD